MGCSVLSCIHYNLRSKILDRLTIYANTDIFLIGQYRQTTDQSIYQSVFHIHEVYLASDSKNPPLNSLFMLKM